MSQEIISSGSSYGAELSLSQYATAHNVSTRTVKRWLADDELPGAEKDPYTNEWRIPAHATRQLKPRVEQPSGPAAVGTAVDRHLFDARSQIQPMPQLQQQLEPSLRDDLDDEPGFLRLEEASRYLGIPRAQIEANPERFGLERVGTNGSYRMPQRVVREIAGY